jgi:hypothetical protein
VVQHRGVRRARVLDVQVDVPRLDRPVAHEGAAEVQLSPHGESGASLDLLCHDLGEQVGFREVFRADDDAIAGSAGRQGKQGDQ